MLTINDIDRNKLINLRNRLKKQFQYAYPIESQKGFFIGVADYVKIVEESDYLSALVRASILSERDKIRKKLDEISSKAIAESKETYKKVLASLKKHNVKEPKIDYAIKECQDFIDGKTIVSGHYATHLVDFVRDIVIEIDSCGYDDIAKKYRRVAGKLIVNWIVAPSEEEMNEVLAELKTQQNISLWAAWECLWWTYATIYKKKEISKTLDKWSFDKLNFYSLSAQMDNILILEGKTDPTGYSYFKIDEFKQYLHRVHNHLESELDDLISATEQYKKIEPKETNFSYDEVGILFYKGEIIINLHKDSGRAKLFKSLWENKVIRNNRITEELKPALSRSKLIETAGYESSESLEKTIGFLRGKLKKVSAEIVAQKGFLLILKD